MSSNGDNHFDDHHTYNESILGGKDPLIMKRLWSQEYNKDTFGLSEKEGTVTGKYLPSKDPSENKSKIGIKYFVNNYDYLPNNKPVFSVKKQTKKGSQTKSVVALNRKRTRTSDTSPVEGTKSPKKSSEHSKEEQKAKKAFKITKSNEKAAEPGKSSGVFGKYPKESCQKLVKDTNSTPNTTPDWTPEHIFSSEKGIDKREDKKISDSHNCVFSYKKVAKEPEVEKPRKHSDEFNDFLFKNPEITRKTREPKKLRW